MVPAATTPALSSGPHAGRAGVSFSQGLCQLLKGVFTRILLVQPDTPAAVGFRTVALPEPLHLEMVAALVPEHEVRILDMRLDSDLDAVLRGFEPEIVAVTALTPEVYAAQQVLQQVKSFSAEIFTVVGGHHATLVPRDFFLPQVDVVAVGEAEVMFRDMVATLADRRDLHRVPNLIWRNGDSVFIRNALSERRVNLDGLPLPRRDLTEAYRHEYFFLFDKPDTSVATSRGCPFRCKFCSVHEFYRGAINQTTPQRVLSEILAVSTDHITFVDDNFLMNCQRENAIADLVKSYGVRRRFSLECL